MIESQRRIRPDRARHERAGDDRLDEVARWVAMRLDFERWLDGARTARTWETMRAELGNVDQPATSSR